MKRRERERAIRELEDEMGGLATAWGEQIVLERVVGEVAECWIVNPSTGERHRIEPPEEDDDA